MTIYLADLGPAGVKALTDLFNEAPFTVAPSPHSTAQIVRYQGEGVTVDYVISFDKRQMGLCHGAIAQLPLEVQKDLKSRLEKIAELEPVAQHLDDVKES